ncbi:predicted transcriptional regulator [Longilinea arvoryzae]|uniref:Predicted transcriptional regulator n=1 Tax=Longilinea arvoryzae TaxID=360412 RepID=A0A0S7BD15_9CHLR|nr:metalloregulator ArsR/SmtB family transcription factor [Longilinea arvoryzae]GAP15614.1 predicted transcriptional regulator [Longilinea arvoryzae]
MVTLNWHSGTGYDFFVSLYVLHHPDEFGLRPSWAAGVRSRLPAEQREFLERAQGYAHVPLTWLASLPLEKRDALDVIQALGDLSPEKRLEILLAPYDAPADLVQIIRSISSKGQWNVADLEAVKSVYARRYSALHGEALTHLCDACAQASQFGRQYVEVLQSYYQAFFAEEEERIRPVLKKGMEEARRMAVGLDPAELVERLSRGVQLPKLNELVELDLAPSYWSSPLIFYNPTGPGRAQLLYGVRPDPAGLVPGENVPVGLVEMLKALADPTRLRILRYLSQEPSTPSQLSRRLRLRAPTVVHHLKDLRLAGLVQVALQVEGEKRYALRREALQSMNYLLEEFLAGELPDAEAPEKSGGRIE